MKKIFVEDELYWKGKQLVFTWHFKEEFEKLRKPVEFVLDILEYGEHILISKLQNKYNVIYTWKKAHVCLSYVEHENIILIHIIKIAVRRYSHAKARGTMLLTYYRRFLVW